MIAAFLQRLAIILSLVNKGVVSLYFADESGFSLTPYIPYGWQPKGEQWAFPTARKKVMNVLGFLNPLTDHLVTYKLPEDVYMNSELFIQYVNDFVATLTQATVVVLDNASWHKSELTQSMIEQWEEQGLYFLFLPPRCPHFNKIETLWRKIKYEWLFIRDYQSENTLQNKITTIFKEYGFNFSIDFSMNFFNAK